MFLGVVEDTFYELWCPGDKLEIPQFSGLPGGTPELGKRTLGVVVPGLLRLT